MIIFPAVDIKDGKCVRLRQGRAKDITIFSSDPCEMAKHWEDLGAEYLHLVDLDGAFEGIPKNTSIIREICTSLSIPVQIGGGIRELSHAASYIEAGVSRIIIGTLALEAPDIFCEICKEFPGKVGVSLDASRGILKSRGWVKDTGIRVLDVIGKIEDMGASFVVYTDISRDGMQSGINPESITSLVEHTSLPVIAAGGVRDMEDIKKLYPLSRKGLEGVITGRAIYEGTLNLSEAVKWIREQKTGDRGDD